MATQGVGNTVAASASTQRNEDNRLEQCVKRLKRNVSDCTQVSNKLAAVLVPLFEDESGVVKVILTKRTSKMNSHSGEVCLPGGKRDEGDKDDAATALREANEEIGLLSSEAEVISELDPMLSKHGLSVKPVVAVVKHDFVPIPSAEEVSSVFSMPLHFFLEGGDNHSHRDADWGGLAYRLHFFQHDDYTVWGLTAAILIEVATVAFGRSPLFEVETDEVTSIGRIHLHASGALGIRGSL